jgi:hypothetical protein
MNSGKSREHREAAIGDLFNISALVVGVLIGALIFGG